MTYLILWSFFGTITFMVYTGLTNLERPKREVVLVTLASGPVLWIVYILRAIEWFLDAGGRFFYDIKCAYEQWKKVRVL